MIGRMSCQTSSIHQEHSLSSKGLISLDRWEGLKEWHRKHQELLQSTVSGDGGTDFNSQSMRDLPLPSQEYQQSGVAKAGLAAPFQHNLSIISEGEEDSCSKENVCASERELPNTEEPCLVGKPDKKLIPSLETISEVKKLSGRKAAEMQSASLDDKPAAKTKRPFLRRGQGLVRYNLHPEDLMHPYRKSIPKNTINTNVQAKLKLQSTINHKEECQPHSSCNSVRESKGSSKEIGKPPSVLSLLAPMQHLVLASAPSNQKAAPMGTWSQVFGADIPRSSTSTLEQAQHSQNCVAPLKLSKGSTELVSPEVAQEKISPLVDEDQESLSAYVDLEQHVGNASFCSTSSKVDRLVAKSSKSFAHPSNPDTIAQSKHQSPRKPNEYFAPPGCNGKGRTQNNVLTSLDLENLLRSRNRHFEMEGGNSKKTPALSLDANQFNSFADVQSGLPCQSSVLKEYGSGTSPSDIASLLDQIGLARKPHLMKTMPSIDLDSSLVRNGLTTVDSDRFSKFDAGSDSSSSSTESDSESSSSSESSSASEPQTKMKTVAALPPSRSSVDGGPNKSVTAQTPLDPTTVEGINKQIESHLNELRTEIKSLQDAKSKSQKYVSGLEKKIQDLEHKLILEARMSSKRLEEENKLVEKRLLEEQSKFQKEKQALQKIIREQRKHLPDPVTQQDLIRLRQEVAQWEEKWRVDRAKARGHESNLRIQITNLKRENEKLKEDNIKLRREKETAINTAKAKSASNTRSINSIAQQLGKSKLKVSSLQKDTLNKSSAYNLKPAPTLKNTVANRAPTIGTFPKPSCSPDEWASEDEVVDLGNEDSENEDCSNNKVNNVESEEFLIERSEDNVGIENHLIEDEMQRRISCVTNGISPIDLTDSTIEEAKAKYDALFGIDTIDLTSSNSNVRKMYSGSAPELDPPHYQKKHNKEDYIKTVHHPNGKIEQVKASGTRVITHPDGTYERHSCSGSSMTVPPSGWPIHIRYFNGDQLEKLEDGTVRYFYAKSNVWQTTFPDGHEALHYESGCVEHRQNDVSSAPCNLNEALTSSKDQLSPHGIRVEKDINGDAVILLPNGERELHTKEYMRKDFLDGTVKFVFKDGSQETRYPSGRIRIKDSKGNLIKDTSLVL